MTGYKPTKNDVQLLINWLKEHDPENANEEVAKQMLVDLKLSFRAIGLSDPDSLEDFYQSFIANRTKD